MKTLKGIDKFNERYYINEVFIYDDLDKLAKMSQPQELGSLYWLSSRQ